MGLQLLNDHQVKSAKIYDGDQRVELQLKDDYKKGNDNYGKSVRFYYVQPRGDEVAKAMESAELESYTDQPVEHSFLGSLVSLLLPILLFGVLFWFLMGRVGGGSSVMSFSKSRAKKFTKDKPDVRFSDVAGVDEALAELEEVREFLAEPEKFTRLGAKIPKGVLLYYLPAPVKPCSPRLWRARLACRSTRFLALTSLKCSWVWVRPRARPVQGSEERPRRHRLRRRD